MSDQVSSVALPTCKLLPLDWLPAPGKLIGSGKQPSISLSSWRVKQQLPYITQGVVIGGRSSGTEDADNGSWSTLSMDDFLPSPKYPILQGMCTPPWFCSIGLTMRSLCAIFEYFQYPLSLQKRIFIQNFKWLY